MKIARKKKEAPKLNLIPILDSVFIFIFFLLLSTQFVQTHEIGTEAPSVRSTDMPHKKDPLNLTANIDTQGIVLTTGLNDKVYRKIAMTEVDDKKQYDVEKFKKTLSEIKSKHVKETSIVFKPNKKVKFEDIVALMDAARGDESIWKKLFSEVAFTPVVE